MLGRASHLRTALQISPVPSGCKLIRCFSENSSEAISSDNPLLIGLEMYSFFIVRYILHTVSQFKCTYSVISFKEEGKDIPKVKLPCWSPCVCGECMPVVGY